MADGHEPLIRRLCRGAAPPGLLARVGGGPWAALFAAAPPLGARTLWGDAYLRHVVLFTIVQAVASTVLSVGLGLPVARPLARRQRFFGRGLLLRLFGPPLAPPTIVATLRLVPLDGQSRARTPAAP